MKNKHFTLVTLSICFLFTLKVGFSKEAKWWFSNTVNASGDWITAPCVFKGGTATYGTDVSGPYLKLDGIDDYFETPAFASPGNNFTVSLFVKSDNAVWNATDALLYKKNGFTLSTHKGTTKISIGLNRNGVLTRYYYDMLVPITDWHHYAVTFDGVKGNVKLFIDGQLAKHVIDVGSIGAEETPLLVGSDGLGKNFFKGGVDDIRIYDFTQLDKIVQTMTRLPDEPTYAWNLAGNLQDSGGNFHLQGLGAIDYVRTYKGIAASLQAGSYLQSLNDFSVSNDTFFISCLMQLNANTEKFPQYTTLMEKIGQLRLEGLGGTKTVRFSVYIENNAYQSVSYTLKNNEHLDSLNQFGGAYNQSANTLDLYFNGKVVAFRVLGSGIIRPYNGKMVIGKGMAGFISQAQIYSYIPSENQISNLGSLDIIAKLPFENGVVDQTGNLTMTAEGAPTFVSDTMGTCVSFNGVAQAASSNAYLQSKNSFSVTCFAKSPTIAWSASSAFVSKENVFYLGTLQGSKKICFSVQSTSGQWTTLFYEPTHDISLWHHYAGTYDVDAKMLSLIYDGKIVSTTPFTGTLNTGSTAVSVGRLSTSSLACQMDDVVIFAYARTNYDYIDVASLNNRVDLVAEGINPQDYKLTFRDEFNGTELDQTKWRFPFTLYRGNTMDPQDTVVGNGTMKLNARYQDGTLYGSYIQTRDLFQQKYGYYEARIKTHKNQGIHSCFWIQSPTYGQIKDDLVFSGAEVDIMEFFGTGRSDGGLAQNIYYNSGADLTGTAVKILATNSGATVDRTISPSTQFHVYGVEWSPAGYQFYVDGKKSIFVASGISGRDEYLILSLYSSDWERPRLNTAALPDNIEVDYVRAFIKK